VVVLERSGSPEHSGDVRNWAWGPRLQKWDPEDLGSVKWQLTSIVESGTEPVTFDTDTERLTN